MNHTITLLSVTIISLIYSCKETYTVASSHAPNKIMETRNYYEQKGFKYKGYKKVNDSTVFLILKK